MHRVAIVRLLSAVAAVAAIAGPLAAQDRFAGVGIRALPIAPGIAMLLGSGGNIGVCAGEDGVVLVDDQFAPLSERIRAAVDSISGGGPIRFVLNTHWHRDHVGGNEAFAGQGAVIVAQDNVRRRMSTVQFRATFQDTIPASPRKALPIVTFTDSVTFHLNGMELRVFHVRNAHTDGDAMVHFPAANAIHMGDCFFNGTYPVLDVSSGGTLDGMIAADDLALALVDDATKIIPGHGPLGDRAALKRFRDMLAAVRERVAPLVRRGKTLEEIVAAKPLADLDAVWGRGFMKADRFLGAVFADLSRPGRP
jgi:glyoxylase-like metal-dependent hydrolase (beta-lactamase superfamily II)